MKVTGVVNACVKRMAASMKILFLDDDEMRTKQMKQALIGQDATFVSTASEAIAALKRVGPFDIASLDHDLGGQQMVESGPNTGYEVALFIINELTESMRPRRVILHSFNPAGVASMATCLKGVEIVRSYFGGPDYWRLFK
jgi:ActR/RegA family two-component response regulator